MRQITEKAIEKFLTYFYLVCALIALIVSALPFVYDQMIITCGVEACCIHSVLFFLCVPCFVHVADDVRRQTK